MTINDQRILDSGNLDVNKVRTVAKLYGLGVAYQKANKETSKKGFVNALLKKLT